MSKRSNGIAAATVPNVCKMPGPPAPFVPTPLPNIGKSGDSPQGYSRTVKIEGQPVAIRGASFGSTGDEASKGTGGGIVSSNTAGPTKFLGLGSLNVKIEGKNVQFLSDPMFNNCGPSGSPANAATMAGVLQGPAVKTLSQDIKDAAQALCDAKCDCDAEGASHTQNCIHEKMHAADQANGGMNKAKTEVQYNMKPKDPTPYMVEDNNLVNPLGRQNKSWKAGFPIRNSRRPDCVVVKDPTRPWSGENIVAVIECKWGKDPFPDPQRKAYEKIAGGEEKLFVMDDTGGKKSQLMCVC